MAGHTADYSDGGNTGDPGHPGEAEGVADWAMHWTPPRPDLIPDLRTRMAENTRRPEMLERTARMLASGRGSIVPDGATPRDSAHTLLAEEYQRLTNAQLYYATPEMTQLAIAAGKTLPDFQCESEDVPDTYGLIVFGEPISSYIKTGNGRTRVPIVAVSWGLWHPSHWPNGGVWLTYYAPSDFEYNTRMMERIAGRPLTDRELAMARSTSGDTLTWDNESALCFGADVPEAYAPGSSRDAASDTTTASRVQAVRAAWLLMAQPNIAEVEERAQSRPVRRRAQRAGHDTGPIRLLHLRRAQRENAGQADGDDVHSREYTCRWMVRGHWRQQWYATRQVHRPIWIAPHIKGPEDQPLRTGETVRIWDRGPTE